MESVSEINNKQCFKSAEFSKKNYENLGTRDNEEMYEVESLKF